jgi:tRNA nucleotidyltransferase (CCA-adding enzyme)
MTPAIALAVPIPAPGPRWEHFAHGADVGVRGFGHDRAAAFEQAAMALTAIVVDPARVLAHRVVALACDAPDERLLLADWLNAVIYEMAVRRMVFARYAVRIENGTMAGRAWGETIDRRRHAPAAEPKGATLTALAVGPVEGGAWRAQCVVDV